MTNKLVTVKNALNLKRDELQAALPSTTKLTAERVILTCSLMLAKNTKLQECTQKSILQSVMSATQLGLDVGGALGQAYLVPYNDKKEGLIAQLIIGYRGYLELARRSDEIESVNAQCVYENDRFEIDLGGQTPPLHSPCMTGDRGPLVSVYCVTKLVTGGYTIEYMTRSDVDTIRSRSRAKNFGPWVTDYNEMARKTVVRRAAKYWPLSTEISRAMDLEDSAEDGSKQIEVVVTETKEQSQKLLEDLQGYEEESETEPEQMTIDVEPKKNVNEEVAKKREQALHVLRETATIKKVGNEEDLLASCKAYTSNYDLESVDSMTLPEIQTVIDKIENRG